jgi:hypothetical protein
MANFVLQGLGLRQPPAHQGQHPLAVFAQLQTPGMAHKQGGATSGLEFGQLAAELGLGALLRKAKRLRLPSLAKSRNSCQAAGRIMDKSFIRGMPKKSMPILQKP